MIGLTPLLLQELRHRKRANGLYLDVGKLVQAFTLEDLIVLQQQLPKVG